MCTQRSRPEFSISTSDVGFGHAWVFRGTEDPNSRVSSVLGILDNPSVRY